MTNLKLLFLVINLVFLRLVLAIDNTTKLTAEKQPPTAADLGSSSAIALEQVNSLDYAPGGTLNAPPISMSSNELNEAELATSRQSTPIETNKGRRTASNSIGKRRSGKSLSRPQNGANVGQLLINLLGQLEKTDFKRLISDAMATTNDKQSTPIGRRSSASGLANATTSQASSKNRSGILSGETDNLLSVTKQLVKLARSQVIGGEFGAPIGSWLAPLGPSMLAAASHAIHDSHDFTGASLKSDWFWVVVPAVIVVGAGVIVFPLIAAWLVSHMMNQNTFTVSAGKRRRRKRDLLQDKSDLHLNGSSSSIHSDLFKLIDVHRLLNHELEPQLLVNKLASFYSALSSYEKYQ